MNRLAITLKRCIQCGGEWDLEAAFRRNTRADVSSTLATYRPRCIGCELSDRNDPTPEERAKRKAQNTIQHHAEKFKMKPSEFARHYGWDLERMVYNILHDHANTCPYCWERYEVMGHGLDDITFDIVDRDQEPYYSTNVKLCCQTCNREKASMSPELWARRLEFWRQYMKHREAVRNNVTHGLPLFNDRQLF